MPQLIPASSYINPVGRQVGIGVSVSVDMGNLPTLPERMDDHLRAALMFHIPDAAEGIIEAAKLSLYKPADFPVHKHGVDTGLLRESLTFQLVNGLLTEGVYYDLLSDKADYWKWVEFGHWVLNAQSPWFWPGYHYLENALKTVGIPLLLRALRAAWTDTALALAREAKITAIRALEQG